MIPSLAPQTVSTWPHSSGVRRPIDLARYPAPFPHLPRHVVACEPRPSSRDRLQSEPADLDPTRICAPLGPLHGLLRLDPIEKPCHISRPRRRRRFLEAFRCSSCFLLKRDRRRRPPRPLPSPGLCEARSGKTPEPEPGRSRAPDARFISVRPMPSMPKSVGEADRTRRGSPTPALADRI